MCAVTTKFDIYSQDSGKGNIAAGACEGSNTCSLIAASGGVPVKSSWWAVTTSGRSLLMEVTTPK